MTTDTIANGSTISLGTIAGTGTTYASATVSSGGELESTTVSKGGAVSILAGGDGTGLTVLSGGVVYDAGTVSSSTFSAAGGTTIQKNLLTVQAGGVATGITVSYSGDTDVVVVSSGGLLSSSKLLGGDSIVYSGGQASGITVSVAGLEVSGGTAYGIDLLYRGHEEIYGGGTTTSTTINASASATLSGGSATSTAVDSGGLLTVASGGYSLSATVSSGGNETISGNGASGSAIGSGSVILAGGTQTLSAGGKEINGTDSGTVNVSSGGSTTSETVASGGVEKIGAGGIASATAVASNGTLSVTTSGTVYGTNVASGGYEAITGNGSSGSAIGSGSVVSAGGRETLTSGGIEIGGTVLGYETVGAGSTISNTSIDGPGATVTLASGATATGDISFGTAGGTLDLGGSIFPGATLVNFAAGDVINFGSLSYVTGASYSTSGNDIIIADGGTDITIATTGLAPEYQVLDNNGYVELVPCFAAGTRILTATGEAAVEDLRVGDAVVTVRDGGPATRRVIWTGKRSLDIARHAMPEMVYPVRICAGAFGPGLPERDLRVSPLHAIYLDGVLTEARALINGATVFQETATRRVTYHHIELEEHDILLAEGLPAESYLDTGSRASFEGEASLVLHPDFRPLGDADFCAPMIRDGDILARVRQRLLDRAAALGFTRTDALDVAARMNGRTLAMTVADGVLRIGLPPGANVVELRSSAVVPAHLAAGAADIRQLGVSIISLTLIAGETRLAIALDDPGHAGLHAPEGGHCWTDGAARLALPAYAGEAVLEIATAGQPPRWAVAAIRDRLVG